MSEDKIAELRAFRGIRKHLRGLDLKNMENVNWVARMVQDLSTASRSINACDSRSIETAFLCCPSSQLRNSQLHFTHDATILELKSTMLTLWAKCARTFTLQHSLIEAALSFIRTNMSNEINMSTFTTTEDMHELTCVIAGHPSLQDFFQEEGSTS